MKILVSDYDGTLSYKIKENIIKLTEFMINNIFIISTGRSYKDFKKKEKLYNIKYNYLILNHGSTIICNGKTIYNKTISKKVLKQLIVDLNKEKIVYSFGCNKKRSRLKIINLKLTKIHVRYENQRSANKIYELLKYKYSEDINCYFVSNNEAIEIVSIEASKKNALEYIKILLNLLKKDIYIVGDDYTDIDMLTNFNGYIMNNSLLTTVLPKLPTVNTVSQLIDIIGNKK